MVLLHSPVACSTCTISGFFCRTRPTRAFYFVSLACIPICRGQFSCGRQNEWGFAERGRIAETCKTRSIPTRESIASPWQPQWSSELSGSRICEGSLHECSGPTSNSSPPLLPWRWSDAHTPILCWSTQWYQTWTTPKMITFGVIPSKWLVNTISFHFWYRLLPTAQLSIPLKKEGHRGAFTRLSLGITPNIIFSVASGWLWSMVPHIGRENFGFWKVYHFWPLVTWKQLHR